MYEVEMKILIGEEQAQLAVLHNGKSFLTCYIMSIKTEEERERVIAVYTFLQVAAIIYNTEENEK